MTDKNGIIDQIEDRLGNEGSRRQAERLLPVLTDAGYVTFDATQGYTMALPEWNDGGAAWNALLARGEVRNVLDPKVANEPAGVLALADTLSRECYNGKPLRDLDPQYQRDMVLEAKALMERYKEQ
jgi:phage/plasmid primase-like uncharacterized protein